MKRFFYSESTALVVLQWICIICVVVGVGARTFSIFWNERQHGDVMLYSLTAESIAHRGDFLVISDTQSDFFYSLKEHGGRFLEHNPLWPVLASGLVSLFDISGYAAVRILSLIAGIFLLPLLFFYARRTAGKGTALLATSCTAISYILIDYSGNGSLYVMQAFFYLLFLYILTYDDCPRNSLWIGVLFAFGLLLNQQTLAMVATYGVYLGIRHWQMPRKEIFKQIAYIILPIAILMTPWWVRNAVLFGSPFFSIDFTYVWGKLGVPQTVSNGVISFDVMPATWLSLAKTSLLSWFPHNLYFINRKLFLLAPITYLCSLFLALEMFFENKKRSIYGNILLPAALLLFFHISISAGWPIAKFRYLVPILPIVYFFGFFYIVRIIESYRLKLWLAGASVLLLFGVSVLTFFSTPTHTYYYDGSLTTDNFGKNGELDFVTNPEQSYGVGN